MQRVEPARRDHPAGANEKAAHDDPPPVLLLAPYAPKGGGMGRMMAYLAAPDSLAGEAEARRYRMVETRGAGPPILSLPYLAWAALGIIGASLRDRRTILHVNMAEGSSVFRKGLLLLLGRRLGLSAVLHLHAADIIAFHARLPRFARDLAGHIFRRADVCIVLGQAWKRWLTDTMHVDPARIEILPNGVPDPGVVAFPAPGCVLLFLGNLLPRKGLPDLIDALSAGSLRGREWQLIVAGGGDTAPLRTQVEQAGLTDRVHFAGWLGRAEVTSLLARATMLILPSYREALPLVLLEAASLGVPIVTTRTGAVPEVFTDGETAMLVQAGDIAALRGAIRQLLDDPAYRARLGRNANALYQRDFSIDIFRRRLAGIYDRHCLRDRMQPP